MDVKAAVEAALYVSSERLTASEIATKAGFPIEAVRTALMDLRREYEERESAIQISKFDNEYKMMLRSDLTGIADMFSRVEMTPGVRRTLMTIAYNQPVLQSELLKYRGPRVYDDVRALVDMEFVARKKAGNSWMLTTTKTFAEHFGFKTNSISEIKERIKQMASNIGTQEEGEGPSERSDR